MICYLRTEASLKFDTNITLLLKSLRILFVVWVVLEITFV